MKKVLVLSIAILFAITTNLYSAYKADTKESKITWKGEKVTGEHWGYVNLKSGTIDYDGKKIKDASFVVDMKSINVQDLEDPGYNKKLTNHLKSDDFFNAEGFPESKFTFKSAKKTGDNKFDITGNLTIRGKTHLITFPATITTNGDKLMAKAELKIDRSKFDVKYNSKSFFDVEALADKLIYDDFYLTIELVAKQ